MVQAVGALIPMGASEERTLPPFDFSNALALASGETIATANCEIQCLRGTDPNPQSHLIAGPTINGNQVSVIVGMLVPYATYRVIITVTTTAGQLLDLWAVQQCAGP